jgi:FkbM family methyltransferase
MKKKQVYDILNKAYFSEEMHERETIEHLPHLLQGATLFVDIGASLGQYTYYANEHMQGGTIVAIEPDPIRFEELQENCQEWELQSNNRLLALNCAVSNVDGQITFYTTDSNVSGGLFPHEVTRAALEDSGMGTVQWRAITVDCATLDTLFKDQSPDLAKIDVEGAELRVLHGATRILKEGKTRFLVELHGNWTDPHGQKDANEVAELMASCGYCPTPFHGRTLFAKRGWLALRLLRLKDRLRRA